MTTPCALFMVSGGKVLLHRTVTLLIVSYFIA
jgi:hypothetical protein